MRAASGQAPLARTVEAPHFFEVVELPDFGPEDVDDDVGAVDQDPVAIAQAFDARRLVALAFEGADYAFGDRPDMGAGAAGGDNHDVGEGGFAVQVDGDDVLGFGIIETGQDRQHKWSGLWLDRAGNRVARRMRRRRKIRG